MNSAVAVASPAGKSSQSLSLAKEAMPKFEERPLSGNIKLEDDPERGRRRSQSDEKDGEGEDFDAGLDGDGDGNQANSPGSDGPARKRRRSRKGLDKKFECPHDGCGKSYSRAEHLYRHQLNHTPKQIYDCDFEGCSRTFVRLDLRNRHRDRHTAKGSALNRKGSLLGHGSPITDVRPPFSATGSASPEANRPGSAYAKGRHGQMPYHSPKDAPYTPMTDTPPPGYPNGATNGADYMSHDPVYPHHVMERAGHHQSPSGTSRPAVQASADSYGVLSPALTQQGFHSQPTNTPQSSATTHYVASHNFPPLSLSGSNYVPTSTSAGHADAGHSYPPAVSAEYGENESAQSGGDMMLLDQMAMQTTLPVFGSDRSPYMGVPEDFFTFLFNNDGSPITQQHIHAHNYSNYADTQNSYSVPYEPHQMGYFPTSGTQQVMSVTNLLDQTLPENLLSDEKSNEIFDFIKERFHENGHAPVERQRDLIIEGDRNEEIHLLSRKMMQAYIASYWHHFSDQVPILHKPTFSPNRTPNLLLIAMMAIGAACLDKAHGHKVTKAGAQLSTFLSWHLRWEIFMDPNFRPPARLWVFQTLILLELYEKMYSTRELHERAHIHHATTITLMRRGRSLIGKAALDSPPNNRDDKTNGSRQSSTSGTLHTPDEWWNHWITNEATRRTAFAAFVIDSIHATMFGHSTVMVAHEMRLPLPCDEKLWKATTGAEVGRLEANLMSVGNKPISFLEGLKRTLNNVEVQTNSFGRTVLMAGLLSVSWHMNQRDLQVNVLGGNVSTALGGRDKWRGTLTRAFDFWKLDFDRSLNTRDSSSDPYAYDSTNQNEVNVVFESRIVLHHLAHMAMHVDIVDCQIFARARRLLGRTIGPQDLASAQRRMKDWASSAKARDATYYALKFLCTVLLVENAGTPQSNGYGASEEPYSARDDVLLNRPWVLYFAALVVWCYGYALEGPSSSYVLPNGPQERVQQMRDYLRRFGTVETPEELKNMKGFNNNSPLLMVLRESFESTRWELLHEGANLLTNCIALNDGLQVTGM